MNLVDSHAHLDLLSKDGTIEAVLSAAQDAGVEKIICIGTSIEASKKCVEIAEKYSDSDLNIYASCGIHPQDGKGEIEKLGDGYIGELKKIAQSSKKVVCIGECGLDYHLGTDSRPATIEAEKEFQRKLFTAQIGLAQELKLPLIVHCRNAWDEIFDFIPKQGPSLPGVFHSWTGDWEAAEKALELGFYISFSGIVTFKNAQSVQQVVKKAPIEQILVETDSPFLSPEPLRGKQNEPKNVRIIAEFIASLRNSSFEQIAQNSSANAARLFKF